MILATIAFPEEPMRCEFSVACLSAEDGWKIESLTATYTCKNVKEIDYCINCLPIEICFSTSA